MNEQKTYSLSEDCETYTFVPMGASVIVAFEGDGELLDERRMSLAEARKLYRKLRDDGYTAR